MLKTPHPKLQKLFFFSKRAPNIKHFFNLFGWAKKVNMIPFFADLSRKNHFSHAHILSKKVHSLKNTLLSWSYFVKKNDYALKNTVLLCHFFQIFHEKPPAVMPIFGQKNVNSVKTTLYYGPKKSMAKKKRPL